MSSPKEVHTMMTMAHATSRSLRAWWLDLPEALRAPLWPSAFAALVIVALLIGFHQVLRQAVHQGELLRMNTATRAEAVWRCKALNGPRVRAACLAQLDAPPAGPPAAAPPPDPPTGDAG